MVVKAFPPLHDADSSGLLAVGGDLEVETLLLAYRQGIFPWPLENGLLAWFSPPRRAILEFEKLHVSRSLAKEIRRNRFEFSVNQAFEEVVAGCRSLENRKEGQGTWISDEIAESYLGLFKKGYGFSVEVWNLSKLVGGLYGVSIGGFLGGESMFFREANASKLAICFLAQHFSGLGFKWLDCQVMTAHMRAFGATLVSRKAFMMRLELALSKRPRDIVALKPGPFLGFDKII